MSVATSKTTAELLVEAEDAYHKLQLGQSPRVFVDQNGERVEYTSANRNALAAYVSDLRRALTAEISGGDASKPKKFTFQTSKGV